MHSESLLELTREDQERVESLLVAFDESWHSEALSEWVANKPPESGDPLRSVILTELVKIDLERKWQSGERPTLELYLEQFPELGTPHTIPAELLLAEAQVRRQSGQDVKMNDYRKRFPHRAEALAALIKNQLGDEGGWKSDLDTLRRSSASVETSRPGSTGDGMTPALPSSADPLARLSAKLDRYRIIRPLGQGGMGAVYLARDTHLDRQVALKIPYFSQIDGNEIVDRFLREARAAATIHHPNLCPVFDVGEVDGVHYMTMAYIEGYPLSDYIDRGKTVSERQAARLVRSLALAIQEAHARDIIHRDLKPSNIMINDRKQPVIMDFGLARRSAADDTALTQTGALLGTPAYMAPEQAKGQTDEIGPCSDIYCLGVILYELLTGQRPFAGGLAEVLSQILTTEPERPSARRSDLDPQLEAICLRAMAKLPVERFSSAAEMAQALTDFLRESVDSSVSMKSADAAVAAPSPAAPADRPASMPPIPSPDPISVAPVSVSDRIQAKRKTSRRPVPPKSIWFAGAGAAAVVLLCLGIVLLIKTPKGTVRIELSDAKADVEVQVDGDTIDLKGGGQDLKFEVGNHELVVQGDDYQLHTQSFEVTRGDNPPIRVELIPQVALKADKKVEIVEPPEQLEGPGLISNTLVHADKVRHVAFSPDGKVLASSGLDSCVRLWDVASGLEIEKLSLESAASAGIQFHPQQKYLAAGMHSRSAGWRFKLWKLPDLEEVKPFGERSNWPCPFLFSNDGNHLFTAGPDKSIVRWNLETEVEDGVFKGPEGAHGAKYLSLSPDGKLLVSTHGGEHATRVWDVESREVLQAFTYTAKGNFFTDAYCALFTPDSKHVVVGSRADLSSYDVESGSKSWGFRRHTWNTRRIALMPDGKAVITIGGEGDIDHAAITNWETGKTVRVLKKYKGAEDIAVHPSGRLIATAGPGRSIKFWDTKNWSEIQKPFQLDANRPSAE